jgi:LysM repeat protein
MSMITQPPSVLPSPTQAAAIVAPTATPGIPTSYTLKKGEFPYCIARRYNVNPSELLRINNLTSTSVLRAGMTLQIPQTGNPFPGNRSLRAHPTTYIVASGDTIYSIACLFGDVDPEAIAYVNNITSPNKQLTPGQTINIP